jgi:hypothetical protein
MCWPLLLLAATLYGQTAMPIGILHGNLVSRTEAEITVRNPSGAIYNCSFDARTYFERDRNPIAAAGLALGDPVEVVADRQVGSSVCYARIVQVVDRRRRAPFAAIESATEWFAPRGDLTFGGVVLRRGDGTVILKTREGEKTLVLRPDTRFWCDGMRTNGNALGVNTRVFVRAGHDFEGNIEVYQAAWRELLPAP